MQREPTTPPRDERVLLAVAAACAGALLLALALPLLRGEIYLDSDLRRLYLPLRFFYQRALRAGSEFLWFPYEFTGFYLHGEGQGGLYHPLNLLAYRWLPFTLAFGLELLRGYAFALLGAFLLLRRFELPASAALLGATLFAFSGSQLLHYMHLNVVAATAHLPWLLLAQDVLARGGAGLGAALAAPLYALLTASQLLIGHPQALWMSLCVELVFALLLWRSGAARGAFLRAAAAKLLGALAAAIQLLPTWDALQHSTRARAGPEFAESFAIHPLDLVQLVQPYLLTERVLESNTAELGIYAGAFGALALAWLALGRLAPPFQARLGRGALALGLLGLWLALGARGGLYSALTALPVIGLFRAPARYALFLHAASALAAALCFAALLRRGSEPVSRAESALALGLPVLSAALALWLLGRDAGVTQGPGPAALGVGVCAATGLCWWIAARGRRAALALLLVLASLDLGLYGLSFVRQRRPAPAPLAALLEQIEVPEGAPEHRRINGRIEATMLGVRYLWGYVALWPRRQLPTFPFDASGVLLEGDELAAWQASMRVASVVAKESGPPLPRARMLSEARVSTRPAAEIGAIDVATTALVDREVALDAGEPGEARIVSERPGEIEIETRAAGRQLLVLSESFHAGWRVWIDGEPGSPLRAYGDFIGCVVPAGLHRVRLHFEPASFTWGARISALALAAIGAWLAAALVATRRSGTAALSGRRDRDTSS